MIDNLNNFVLTGNIRLVLVPIWRYTKDPTIPLCTFQLFNDAKYTAWPTKNLSLLNIALDPFLLELQKASVLSMNH